MDIDEIIDKIEQCVEMKFLIYYFYVMRCGNFIWKWKKMFVNLCEIICGLYGFCFVC